MMISFGHHNHLGKKGLEDNCAALALQGLCAFKDISQRVEADKIDSEETCPMCHPVTGCLGTNSTGEIAGRGGRCER